MNIRDVGEANPFGIDLFRSCFPLGSWRIASPQSNRRQWIGSMTWMSECEGEKGDSDRALKDRSNSGATKHEKSSGESAGGVGMERPL
jgi:hypothetical protein